MPGQLTKPRPYYLAQSPAHQVASHRGTQSDQREADPSDVEAIPSKLGADTR